MSNNPPPDEVLNSPCTFQVTFSSTEVLRTLAQHLRKTPEEIILVQLDAIIGHDGNVTVTARKTS